MSVRFHLRIHRALAVSLVFWALAASAGEPFLLGPPPGGGPVDVEVGFRLAEVNDIDEENETFEFGGVLTLKWHDERQAFDPAEFGVDEKVYQGNFQFNEVFTGWWPQLVLSNQSGGFDRQESC